ncbi:MULTISPECIES: hypothetical protein [Streptomyces]|uniref:hypothetical protein n=1 Tax=Streptomyces TaxID=1883 RepID=UPI0003A80507|nr:MULTISPECIES: hypothetical protein [Streptomyces]
MNAPGADELRMRYLLRRRGVGPDARPDTPDETSERKPDTAAPAEPSHVRGGGRLPDWRRGELVDLEKPDAPEPGPPARPKRQEPEPESPPKPDKTEPDDEEDQADEPASTPPPWDPVAVADRIVQAQKERTLADRARHLATAAKAGPRLGRLVYAASGVWAAWHVGLTPWLLSVTATAPLGVPAGLVLVGWALHRRSARAVLPVAWCGHALFTATVITLALHP